MATEITVHCTLCGNKSTKVISNRYGESGQRYSETFVAGCNKCPKPKHTTASVSHSSGGGYSSSSSGGDGGCVGTIGGLFVLGLIAACCCGGLGGKE